MTTVDPQPDKRSKVRARRDERLDARQVLWRESSLPRLRKCGYRIAPTSTAGVNVRVTGTGAERCAGFGGLEACGSVWACPVCSAKIAAGRQSDIAAAATTWQTMPAPVLQDGGRGLVFASFTMRHRKGQSLTDLWDGVADAWKRATGGDGWIADQAVYGVPVDRVIKTSKRGLAGQIRTSWRIPIVRVVEVTHGRNGWHVHVHALLFTGRRLTLRETRTLAGAMYDRWAGALVAAGFDAPTRRHGVEAHPVHGADAADAFGFYLTKGTYTGPEAVALEVARGDLKAGRGGNRTPFAILRSVYTTGDEADLTLWHIWEQGSKGRRQIAWSPGLRDLVGLNDAEASDQELAEAEHGGATLAVITRDAWYGCVVRARGRQAGILAAAEVDDDGVTLFRHLHDLGVAFDVPEPDAGTPMPPPPASDDLATRWARSARRIA